MTVLGTAVAVLGSMVIALPMLWRNLGLVLRISELERPMRELATYGHDAGDEVLRQVAALLTASLRTSDLVGRYGGEEFVVALPETDKAGGFVVAEKLRTTLEATPIVQGSLTIPVTASLGLACVSEASVAGIAAQIHQADQALYQSKRNGRNQTTIF